MSIEASQPRKPEILPCGVVSHEVGDAPSSCGAERTATVRENVAVLFTDFPQTDIAADDRFHGSLTM